MDDILDIHEYDVFDRDGRRLGPLTGFWVDAATRKPEFGGVKTGWLLGKNHVVPIGDARIDHARRAIRLAYDERRVRDAPTLAPDADLDAAQEERIYAHYGLSRNLSRSPTGLPGAGGTAAGRGSFQGRSEEIPLHEERVNVGKRTVEEGVVRLRKVVRSEVVEVPVELRRERVDVERVPPSQLRSPAAGDAFREKEITMRERREEPVIEKTREVVGGVRATKEVRTERENVRADVRREDVEVEGDDERDLRRS